MNISDLILSNLSGNDIEALAQQVGVDPRIAGDAFTAFFPVITSAMNRNASTPEGAQSLFDAIVQDHGGSELLNASQQVRNPDLNDGAAILQHLFGPQEAMVEDTLSQSLNIDSNQIAQLMQIAAPLILSAFGYTQSQGNQDVNEFTSFLQQQNDAIESDAPGSMALINRLLDQDNDGSIIDDIAGFLGRLLGR